MEASIDNKKSKGRVMAVPAIILLVLLLGAVVVFTILGNQAGGNVLTQNLSEPVGNATAARFDFNVGTGNLTIDRLASNEQGLVSGALQYLESQGQPTRTLDKKDGLYTYTLKADGGRQPGFALPWAACNGETNWQLHLTPNLPADITANSGGGNMQINLAGMKVTRLAADTGGGNVDVTLPDHVSDMSVTAKSGGGNVTVVVGQDITGKNTVVASSGAGNVAVHLPGGIAARIHASSGVGKLAIDSQFTKIDDHTFQSTGYTDAADKIEITVESGAGDVSVITK